MGDFYEMFYEDAITAARDLEITLTKRGKNEKAAPLAGVPYHALENYLGKLIKKGHKVAIIEQLEDPKKAKGLVKRGLVRIVTPGTVIESNLLNANENNYLMALSADGEDYSYSVCDLSTGEFLTGKLNSTEELLAEIQRRQVSECVVPESLMVNHELINAIKKLQVCVNKFDDYHYRSENANRVLLEHFKVQNLSAFGFGETGNGKEKGDSKISVVGALLKYLQDTQKTSLAHLKKIGLIHHQDVMQLDRSTLRNLELLQNIRDFSTRGTILSVIDHTVNPLGSRMLKRFLKEPLLRQVKIEERLDAVEELNKQVIAREELRELLKDVYDLERLIGRVNYGNANPKDLLALKSSLLKVPLVKSKLAAFKSELLQKINGMKSVESLEPVAQLIENSVREDAPLTLREGGMIKPEFNQELNELVNIKRNSKKYLQQIEEKERDKTGISTLRVAFNRVFGYFIEVSKRNIPNVPDSYIRKQTTANSERYITEELKLEEEKILGAEEKIHGLEYQIFQDVCEEVKKHTSVIQDAAQKLALLDVMCCFSKVAMENNYCRPKFNVATTDTNNSNNSNNFLEIINGRHPVLEKLEDNFISNSVKINEGEIMIITGPNTSGKSTVMRQTALIVLMAQMGCFVPAESAELSIVDRIFTRVGAHDDLSFGQSTFMVEMLETANILNNATKNSLILLDEIGRGTSTFDGVAIAWSTAEYIYNNIKAKTMFATHYHVLNKMAERFDNIKNYNIAVKELGGEIIYLRKLVEGGTDQSHGVHVAKLAGMPEQLVKRAKEIQAILEAEDEMVKKIKAKKIKEQMSLENF